MVPLHASFSHPLVRRGFPSTDSSCVPFLDPDSVLIVLPRLALPSHVRIVFEVDSLQYATPATVSRCGMVYFTENTITNQMLFASFFKKLSFESTSPETSFKNNSLGLTIQTKCINLLRPYFTERGSVEQALNLAREFNHIMGYNRFSLLTSFFSLVGQAINEVQTMSDDFTLVWFPIHVHQPKPLFVVFLFARATQRGLLALTSASCPS